MENWQLWAAIYISGVFTAMYALWLPSWRVIKKIQPDNIIMGSIMVYSLKIE